MKEFSKRDEYQRALAAGMTPAEAQIWCDLGAIVARHFILDTYHAEDARDFAAHARALQNIILSRVPYREFLRLAGQTAATDGEPFDKTLAGGWLSEDRTT